MTQEREGAPQQQPNESRAPALSPAVSLEVALLHAEQRAEQATPTPFAKAGVRVTVLVASPDADGREYIRECLRRCDDLHLIESDALERSIEEASQHVVQLLIVDLAFVELLAIQLTTPAIVLVDDLPRSYSPRRGRIRLMVRPFSAEELVSEVRRALLADPSR